MSSSADQLPVPDGAYPGPTLAPEVLIETLRLLLLAAEEDHEWFRARIWRAADRGGAEETNAVYNARRGEQPDYGRTFQWLADQAETPSRWIAALASLKTYL